MNRLLAAKAQDLPSMSSAATTIQNVVTEQTNHRAFCAEWGISVDELENAIESPACTAYGAYLIDVAVRSMLSLFHHSKCSMIDLRNCSQVTTPHWSWRWRRAYLAMAKWVYGCKQKAAKQTHGSFVKRIRIASGWTSMSVRCTKQRSRRASVRIILLAQSQALMS
jgi:hypothetical protein